MRTLLAAAVAVASGWGVNSLPIECAGCDGPPFEQHFSPAENLEAIDVALIANARTSIDMAAYLLTDWTIQDDLVLAARRGVRMRILIDQGEARHTRPQFVAAVVDAGGQIRASVRGPLMHLKTYCVDGTTLRFGAANFSYSGLTEQANDLDITRGPHACDGFMRTFERLWGR